MEILLAEVSGFCYGVKRAVDIAGNTVRSCSKPVFSLGPLIHNPQVVEQMRQSGIRDVDNINELKEGALIIRSHGVTPAVLNQARAQGLKIVDATCPFVGRAQAIASDMSEQGYQVVIVGDKNHPEVHGILGWAGNRAEIVADAKEASQIKVLGNVAVVAQTTQREENFNAVVETLERAGVMVKAYKTICNATAERQTAACELARQVDVMIVVGGAESANTRKLAEICRSCGTTTYHIEEAGELDPSWFRGVRAAGLTAGASTPDWIIEEVMSRMSEFEELNNSEEGMQNAVEVKTVRNGEIVTGTVVQIDQDEVVVDVGAKSEGVIPIRELSCCEVTSIQDIVKVGDQIEVYVLKAEDNEGRLILSKEKADAERAWTDLEEALETGQAVEGTVREVVKGGLLVDLGVRAFLPASLVDRGYVEDLSKYLGQDINVRVIEINRAKKKVILSRKAILEEEFTRLRQELMNTLEEGQAVKGVVRRLTQFGAFIDIGGVDGLLHISEMAWHRINHPSEVVNIGDEIEVKVLRVDRESEKISLGLKQLLPNPWDTVEQKYPVNSIVTAKVVRLAPFGAFVQLEPGVEGLVHISHLADRHVAKPDEVVTEGEEVNVKVLSVDPAEKRIRLSIREVTGEKQAREYKEYKEHNHQKKTEDNSDVVTIGDMVGDLFNK
jgi:small subunit ribosomal protein S1